MVSASAVVAPESDGRRRRYSPFGALARLLLGAALIQAGLAVPVHPAAASTLPAPSNVTAVRGVGDIVNVTWESVTDATEYTVKAYTTEAGSATWDACGADGRSATSCTDIDPLRIPRTSDGWVEVTAEQNNVAGTPSARVRVLAYPGSPTAVAAASAPGGLAVTWTPPTAGATPTSYTASAYSDVSGGTVVASCTTSTTACTISDLTNGTAYYVEVTSSAAVGSEPSATSDPSPRVAGIPRGVPAAPASVDLTGGDTIITASWSAPSTDGGSPITGYVAEAFTAATGGTLADSCEPATVAAMRCELEGLNNGTTYYVQVTARNVAGSGPATNRVAAQPGGRATAPRSVEVLRGDGTLEISWTAPVSDGGAAITSYTARAYTSSLSNATAVASCTATGLSCTISGLANATTYYVNVIATTAVGASPPSPRITVRASSAPSQPRDVKAPRGNGYSKVSWRTPLNLNGSVVTSYIARAYLTPEGGNVFVSCEAKPAPGSSSGTPPLTCDLGPLPNGTTYYVDVVAVTPRFVSEPSSPRVSVLTATTPDVPRLVTASQVGKDVVAKWAVPSSDGGQPISRYTATAYTSATSESSLGSCTSSGDTCTIRDIVGPPLYIDVTSTTAAGTSAPSTPRVKVVLLGSPSQPREVSTQRDGRKVIVSWLRSVDDGDSPVTSYTAQITDSTERLLGSCTVKTPPGGLDIRMRCSVGKIPAKISASASVIATNATSATSSEPVAVPRQSGALTVPRALQVLPAERSLVASAERAANDDAQTAYVFTAWTRAEKGKQVARCVSPAEKAQPTCLLTGLDNYVPVWVESQAQRRGKSSAPTMRITGTPMASVPSQPRGITVAVRGQDARVRWQAPLSDGGYPIRGYTVTAYGGTEASEDTVVGTCAPKKATRTCTLPNLPTEYVSIRVVATNAVGVSEPSTIVGRNVPSSVR